MKPQRFTEGELIFLRALGALGDDDAARFGVAGIPEPLAEGIDMAGVKVCMSLEHEGTRVTIDQPGDDQGGVEMHGGAVAGFDFGKWARVAACVASCLVGGVGMSETRENVAAGHDVKPTGGKPAK